MLMRCKFQVITAIYPLPTVLSRKGVQAGADPTCLQARGTKANVEQTSIHTHAPFLYPQMHVFGLWEEARVPGNAPGLRGM